MYIYIYIDKHKYLFHCPKQKREHKESIRKRTPNLISQAIANLDHRSVQITLRGRQSLFALFALLTEGQDQNFSGMPLIPLIPARGRSCASNFRRNGHFYYTLTSTPGEFASFVFRLVMQHDFMDNSSLIPIDPLDRSIRLTTLLADGFLATPVLKNDGVRQLG